MVVISVVVVGGWWWSSPIGKVTSENIFSLKPSTRMTNTRPYLFIRSHKPKHPIFCPASRERTSDIQGAASFRWVFLLQEHATGSSDAKALLILTPDYVVLHRVPPVKPYTSWLNWISNSGVPISGNRQDPLPKSQTLLKQSSSCPLSARFLFAINVVYLTYHKKSFSLPSPAGYSKMFGCHLYSKILQLQLPLHAAHS